MNAIKILCVALTINALAFFIAWRIVHVCEPITITKSCEFVWNDGATAVPAKDYGRKNFNESVEMFGEPKVECERWFQIN